MIVTQTILITLFVITACIAGLFYVKYTKEVTAHKGREDELRRRMYELAILKEIGDRVGYSLNVEKVVDVITGSLGQFIEYSVASYMLLTQDRIVFKANLDRGVSKEFVTQIRKRMLESLGALLNEALEDKNIEETITGSIMIESDAPEPVRSFFNIPLVIQNKVIGVLTVAHTKEGMYKEAEMTLLYKVVYQASREISKLQEVVETEEEKLNAMVSSMAEGVVMTDKDYRVAVVNPAARKVLGFKTTDDVSIFDLIDALSGHFDIRGKLEESVKLDKVITQGDVFLGDKFFQIFVSPVKSSNGKEVLGGVVIFHDISHDKDVEKMREDFTSMMVHELRSPLDGIKKMGEMLKMDDSIRQDKDTFYQYIDLMHDGSSNMLELVNDLLDVAKMEAGKFEIKPIPGDIGAVVRERVTFFDSSARDAKIKLVSAIDPNVPQNISFDKRRISQVVTNILANGLKFTDPGGEVAVQVLLHKKGQDIEKEAHNAGIAWRLADANHSFTDKPDMVFVAVTDTGVGIPNDKIGQLFNKFKQLESNARTQNKSGSGLGLVIAKGIVEAHGGIMGVASEEGAGSTFYFTLNI